MKSSDNFLAYLLILIEFFFDLLHSSYFPFLELFNIKWTTYPPKGVASTIQRGLCNAHFIRLFGAFTVPPSLRTRYPMD
jgi:hypothetical protein